MEHGTTNPRRLVLAAVAVSLLASLLIPAVGGADGLDPGRLKADGDKPTTEVKTKVESRSDGVYIQISVRQSVPGAHGSASSDHNGAQSTTTGAGTSGNSGADASANTTTDSGASSASATSPGRSWTDRSGYHYETPTGQVVTLTPPNISSATRQSWMDQLQQHQNQNPYLLYVDQQFNGVIWVPQSSGNSNIVLAPMPANPPAQNGVTGGNGASTDPREVALDALDHQPLPDAQIRMNPALGLVAMSGWFWVEGYDGKSFGTSRTVEVPPEVGSDVPTSAVPANDPRRQGTSFTVEVRLWPTRYEWSFGDGATQVSSSLGQPYPAQSQIQHTYEYSSLQFPDGFPVSLTIEFGAEFRVNGGAPQPLPSIRRTYAAGYRVQEVQPVLTNNR